MASDQWTSAPQRPRWIIWWLIIAHVAIGLAGAAAMPAFPNYRDPAWDGVFVGNVYGQASLLGIWGGLGQCVWWKRLGGVLGGIGYLASLLDLGTCGPFLVHPSLLGLTSTIIAAVLLLSRLLRIDLQLESSPAPIVSRIQFTIRHLMLLTLVTACAMGIGKTVSPHFISRLEWGEILTVVVFAIVGAIPVGLLATRYAMGYGLVCILIGATTGNFGSFWADGFFFFNQAFYSTTFGAESATVVVSLWALRYGGYRLKRLPRQQPTTMER